MELVAVIVMIAAGIAIAGFVMTAAAIARRENAFDTPDTAPDRNRLAASLLFQIITSGGTSDDEALRQIRRVAGIAAPVTGGIDVSSWAQRFAQLANEEQRRWLLEMAVQLIATRTDPVPLRQYTSLLDLSFALGFHTDALAKLREQYGFEYVDHAKDARPREADRAGGATTFFSRQLERHDTRELLLVLGIEGKATRQEIISRYRRLAAQHHPDRFHDQTAEAKAAAAAKFIEITRAYEILLALYRD